MFERCKGSGTEQMLDWFPDKNYAGACVCIHCSYGVLIRKHSDHEAISASGFKGMAGTLRVHYVKHDKYHEPVAMRYRP